MKDHKPGTPRDVLRFVGELHDLDNHDIVSCVWERDAAALMCSCGKLILVDKRDCHAMGVTLDDLRAVLRNVHVRAA